MQFVHLVFCLLLGIVTAPAHVNVYLSISGFHNYLLISDPYGCANILCFLYYERVGYIIDGKDVPIIQKHSDLVTDKF